MHLVCAILSMIGSEYTVESVFRGACGYELVFSGPSWSALDKPFWLDVGNSLSVPLGPLVAVWCPVPEAAIAVAVNDLYRDVLFDSTSNGFGFAHNLQRVYRAAGYALSG